jgi:hypothetical protein
MDPTSAEIDVPGDTPYHEIRGNSPALVLIPGGEATKRAETLADRYLIITRDRRGFGGERCVGGCGGNGVAGRISSRAPGRVRSLIRVSSAPQGPLTARGFNAPRRGGR